jgi:hypothetical protein
MTDFTRVDWSMLRAARLKCRQNIKEADRSGDHSRLHTAQKISSFLREALPDAWDAAEEHVPDAIPEDIA